MNKNVLVIGAGEIGQSIISLYKDISDYTLYYLDINKKIDTAINIQKLRTSIDINTLHVCIPFIEDFTDVITSYIYIYKPLKTFIHSTVKVGTTREIYNNTGSKVFFTPVMGIHPNLTESLTIFKKIVGVFEPADQKIVLDHFNDIRVTPVFYSKVEDAEAAKLFSTSYYGTVIRYMQDVHDYCELNELDFENVYKTTNMIYNEGYKKLGMEHVVRPILKYGGRGIGGHCVLENAKLLAQDMWLPSIRSIVDEGKNNKKGGFASRNNDNK